MVRSPLRKKQSENGQAVVFVLLGMSIFLLAAVGLAIDGSQLYAQRQMAQAAADSAATAGIVSIFNGTNTGTNTFGASAYDCTTSNATTPCVYAQTNGFGTTSGTGADTVHVDPNPGVTACGPGTSGSCSLDAGTPNELRVTITRPVPMTLTKLLGLSSFNVQASATAAVLDVLSPIPILVLNPSLKGSFSINGSGSGNAISCSGSLEVAAIVICGGPSRSIQVNSSASNCSISGNPNTCSNTSGTVDLSQAGPNGTGADFGDIGGPGSYPGTLLLGSSGHYRQPVGIFDDPLASMSPPPKPTTIRTGPIQMLPPSTPGSPNDCPSNLTTYAGGVVTQCALYAPGYYDQGINVTGQFAIFQPGIYYINHKGFAVGSNGIARMATAPGYALDPTLSTDPAHTSWTSGMLVYNDPGVDGTAVKPNKDIISIAGANAGTINNYSFPDASKCGTDSSGNPLGGNCLVGANGGVLTSSVCLSPGAAAAMYYGVLFFQSRTTPASLTHTLGGGGSMSLKGTIYLHDPSSGYANYQTLNLQGSSGNTTTVQGEIIVDALGLGGTSGITMNLSTLACYTVKKIALIQ